MTTAKPKVTVIVPVHNSESFLEGLFNGLRGMDFTNWECICVNNFSSDTSLELLNALKGDDERFIIKDHSKKGVSAARNFGLQLATGEYIQFLDADDIIAERKLSVQVDYMESHPDCGLVFGDARYWKGDEPGKWIMPPWKESDLTALSDSGESLVAELLKGNRLVISAPLFRRSLVHQCGELREDMPYNEDWEFWLRLARSGTPFHYTAGPDAYSHIRLHSTSASTNLSGMYHSELEIYRIEYRNKLNSTRLKSIAKKYFYKTWIEIMIRKLKGDKIKLGGMPVWI